MIPADVVGVGKLTQVGAFRAIGILAGAGAPTRRTLQLSCRQNFHVDHPGMIRNIRSRSL
jgi:hypothetical protein